MCCGGIYRYPWRPEKLDPSKVSKAERQCSMWWSRVAWGVTILGEGEAAHFHHAPQMARVSVGAIA